MSPQAPKAVAWKRAATNLATAEHVRRGIEQNVMREPRLDWEDERRLRRIWEDWETWDAPSVRKVWCEMKIECLRGSVI